MTDEDFKEVAGSLPKQPGVYRFLNLEGKVIYVGKAKNLRSRISSYFGDKKHQYFKTRTMVKHAHHFEFTIVESEQDALLLENTLIKQIQLALYNGKDRKSTRLNSSH